MLFIITFHFDDGFCHFSGMPSYADIARCPADYEYLFNIVMPTLIKTMSR